MSAPWKFRCPVCGHWCNPADGYGFICSKRGGCGSEFRDEDLDALLPDEERALIEAGRRHVSAQIDMSDTSRTNHTEFS